MSGSGTICGRCLFIFCISGALTSGALLMEGLPSQGWPIPGGKKGLTPKHAIHMQTNQPRACTSNHFLYESLLVQATIICCWIKPSITSLTRRMANVFQPVETKLSNQTFSQLFYLSQQNCLTANKLYGKNACGKEVYSKIKKRKVSTP